ncbi:MAG TPA: PHP-associated domain-containing protein [Vicinamibacterales bacterium]|jgi:predicted metal-dependent phosphoesterase TrpH|nr:PHP-associated domain-containing protein [Vicinamibacterales bacterium]
MLKVELHTHTSDDPIDPIPYSTFDLIDRAAELEYDALAITLHDKQLDTAIYTQYAASRGIVLVPGIERTIDGRHVLLLNFSRASEAVGSFDDLRALKAREQGLVIAPHPFFPAASALRGWTERHADVFDAIEYNAMFTRYLNFNILGERWAARHGKPMVGNCDVHRLQMLGTTYSLVDAAPNADSICSAIAAGHVHVVATPLSMYTAARLMADLYAGNFVPRRYQGPDPATALHRRQTAVASRLDVAGQL